MSFGTTIGRDIDCSSRFDAINQTDDVVVSLFFMDMLRDSGGDGYGSKKKGQSKEEAR